MTDKKPTGTRVGGHDSTIERVLLGAGVERTIRDHGCKTYPHECCGALIACDGMLTEAYPLPNTTEEGPRRRFLVRPSDYRAAEAHARALGGELAGFYHSHPDHPARPSQYDLDHAWPNFTYIIVSVVKDVAGELTAWRLRDDRTAFEALSVEPEREARREPHSCLPAS